MLLQNKDAPKEEFDGKLADLKKELGYWESYLGSNKYIAGSQYSLAGGALLQDVQCSMMTGVL